MKPIRETGTLATQTSGTRRPIQIITPGWGSSGYYSPAVLEAAAAAKVIPAGTHMYFNHATESERTDRPERDVRDIAAVLAEDAQWDGTGLVAEANIMGPHAELIDALAPYIGVSISGSATDITIGEAEGRTGPIIEGLAEVASVDFVTHAGRGGRLLESARPSIVNALAVGHGVAEATVNDTRDALQQLLRDAYGGEKSYVWVRDFDETTVWFELDAETDGGLYAQTYTGAGAQTAIEGDRVEVRVVTTYVPISTSPNVPVTRPGSTTTTTTEESEEDAMPQIQIEEAEHARLTETAGRVPTLESERDAATARAETAEAALAAERRTMRAMDLVREHAHTFNPLEARGLVADLPLTEAGELDVEAFTRTLNEHAARVATAKGAGTVTGFGSATETGATVEAAAPVTSPWGRALTEKKGA